MTTVPAVPYGTFRPVTPPQRLARPPAVAGRIDLGTPDRKIIGADGVPFRNFGYVNKLPRVGTAWQLQGVSILLDDLASALPASVTTISMLIKVDGRAVASMNVTPRVTATATSGNTQDSRTVQLTNPETIFDTSQIEFVVPDIGLTGPDSVLIAMNYNLQLAYA